MLTCILVDQRLEDLRVSEQAADVARQEKLLKLISNELTKNTTRVVEMAVKAEVLNSVLPSLENITKNEVKAVLNGQIAKGLGDSMSQVCPLPAFFHSATLTISFLS
jgi:CTP-dependent riboflavin kinase